MNLSSHDRPRNGDRSFGAGKEFETAVAIDPAVPLFHHNLAILLRDVGRRDEALVECKKAVELNPVDFVYHFTLGNLLRDLGQEDEALAEFQEALRIDPDSAAAHSNLANVLLDMGRREEARQEADKFRALAPKARQSDLVQAFHHAPDIAARRLQAAEEFGFPAGP